MKEEELAYLYFPPHFLALLFVVFLVLTFITLTDMLATVDDTIDKEVITPVLSPLYPLQLTSLGSVFLSTPLTFPFILSLFSSYLLYSDQNFSLLHVSLLT